MNAFAKRPNPGEYYARDIMHARSIRLAREARLLDPHSALVLARGILTQLKDEGVSYADFESAQHAANRIGAASALLEEVS